MAMGKKDWASLPPELVGRIADCLLDTNDIDTYVDMRAVCPGWRSAIPRPPPLGADDLRFRPTQWVILDAMFLPCDQSHLFLNVSTGRFLRRRFPPLPRTHAMLGVASSGGLLLVEEFPEDDNNSVDDVVADALLAINPFTGSMLRFPAIKTGLPRGELLPAAISSSDPPMAVVRHRLTLGTYASAQPTSEFFQEHFFHRTLFTSTVTFQGSFFMATTDGRVLKAAATPQEPGEQVVPKITRKMDIKLQLKEDRAHVVSCLVESDGELLLVRHCLMQALKVFRVDVQRGLLQPLSSIGRSRALFLGEKRCVSVDAAKFPSIAGDCVYVHNTWELVYPPLGIFMYKYDLRGGPAEIIAAPMVHPCSLVHLLLQYCG